MFYIKHFMFLLVLLLFTACASTPKFDAKGVDLSITPKQVTSEIKLLKGAPLIWGGIIITANNLKESTQFEVLAYPLDSDFRPKTDMTPLGRFISLQTGYVEISDYEQGRMVTFKGAVKESRKGTVGETEYTYPVIDIDKAYLWPKRGEQSQTRFHFGIGVMFSD